ncbi:MAG: chemotaxis protein CheW [Myxococcota bacterium]|nr:chemotaxis protein CheW [Myxococcota bacterium]
MSVLHVLFRVGDAEYAIPASDVLQMESYEGATAVPNAPPYLAGIVQVRGRVVPVIDLRARFGLPATPRTIDTRVLVAQLGERVIGLLVDTAREVARLDPEQVRPPPAMIASQSAGLVRAIGQLGNRMLMLVDLEKLLVEERAHGE